MTSISFDRHEQFCKVTLPAQFTAPLVPDLQTGLKQLLADGVTDFNFDLSSTRMLDSSGIGLLTATSNSLAKHNGSMKVTGVAPEIQRLLQMMRLVDRLNVSGCDA
jgi:anti-sigma B factor antagonist